MRDEIEGIKDMITSFAQEVEDHTVKIRIGLIAFRDRYNQEEPEILNFDGSPFTNDVPRFQAEVGKLRAKGGGDIPESSLDALLLASRQPFAEQADRVIVLITDAPPHIPDCEASNLLQVSDALRTAKIRQLYIVADLDDEQSKRAYLKLLEGTVGVSFRLGKNNEFQSRAAGFKQTLMQLGSTIGEKTRPHNLQSDVRIDS